MIIKLKLFGTSLTRYLILENVLSYGTFINIYNMIKTYYQFPPLAYSLEIHNNILFDCVPNKGNYLLHFNTPEDGLSSCF
jgi:hypothetical protein